MALYPHQHDWSQTHDGFKCVNCSASVSQAAITQFLVLGKVNLSPGLYGRRAYGSGLYGSGDPSTGGPKTVFAGGPSNVVHGDLPANIPDLIHLVDFVWFASGGIGIPLT